MYPIQYHHSLESLFEKKLCKITRTKKKYQQQQQRIQPFGQLRKLLKEWKNDLNKNKWKNKFIFIKE